MLANLELWLTNHWSELALFAAGWLVASVVWAWRHNVNVRRSFEAGLVQNADNHAAEITLAQDRLDVRTRDLVRTESRLDAIEDQLSQSLDTLRSREGELNRFRTEHAALQARLEESQKAFAEKEALFQDTSDALKKEFEALANSIFQTHRVQQTENLGTILGPFKEQIRDFKARVEQVYDADTKDRASLLAQVRNLQSASDRINEEAQNLTQALRGDKKLQGNWGELVLERVLEESGLRVGFEYELQVSSRDAGGSLKRPDVVIRLPEGKDIVIDAKVTLGSYEEALAAEEPALRELALNQHLANLRNHVKKLASQDYDRLDDIRSLDFVLMFIPIESAFTLAMQQDPKLFSDAFTKRIVVVSPTTLMMTLRIIHNVWRYEKQNRNAEEIARRAGALYDKLRGFVEEMDKLGGQVRTLDKTYKSAYAKLVSGKGNLVRQAEQFRELGADVKKRLPKPLVEEASEPAADAGDRTGSSGES